VAVHQHGHAEAVAADVARDRGERIERDDPRVQVLVAREVAQRVEHLCLLEAALFPRRPVVDHGHAGLGVQALQPDRHDRQDDVGLERLALGRGDQRERLRGLAGRAHGEELRAPHRQHDDADHGQHQPRAPRDHPALRGAKRCAR
jgi:hypothetical protein